MKDFLLKIWNWIVSIPKDKLLHDYAGDLIATYSFVICLLFLAFWPAAIIANVLAVLALLGKGVYDYFHPATQSVEIADFLYGVFGVIKFDIALVILYIALKNNPLW